MVVRNWTTNISCSIERLDGSAFALKEIEIDFAQEVLVFDWEEDGSFGNFLIPVTNSFVSSAVTLPPSGSAGQRCGCFIVLLGLKMYVWSLLFF